MLKNFGLVVGLLAWLAHSYAAEQMRIVQSGSERKDLLAA